MRKTYIETLTTYVDSINKAIFDLDVDYLKINGYPNIDEIKKSEMDVIFSQPYYVYNECLKINPNPKQRFVLSVEIPHERGNTIYLTIQDNLNNSVHSEYFRWVPLKYQGVYRAPRDVNTWVNNKLGELRCLYVEKN